MDAGVNVLAETNPAEFEGGTGRPPRALITALSRTMPKKRGLADLIGREIVAVTVKDSDKRPSVQLFLTLDDGSFYEIWSDDPGIGFGSMAYDGGLEEVRSRGRECAEIVFEVVQGENGRPRQTVVTKACDLIEGRKSLGQSRNGDRSSVRPAPDPSLVAHTTDTTDRA